MTKTQWAIAWAIPFLYIAILEGYAIFDGKANTTLSAHIWKWMGTSWGWERIAGTLFLLWFLGHIILQGLGYKGMAR